MSSEQVLNSFGAQTLWWQVLSVTENLLVFTSHFKDYNPQIPITEPTALLATMVSCLSGMLPSRDAIAYGVTMHA